MNPHVKEMQSGVADFSLLCKVSSNHNFFIGHYHIKSSWHFELSS